MKLTDITDRWGGGDIKDIDSEVKQQFENRTYRKLIQIAFDETFEQTKNAEQAQAAATKLADRWVETGAILNTIYLDIAKMYNKARTLLIRPKDLAVESLFAKISDGEDMDYSKGNLRLVIKDVLQREKTILGEDFVNRYL
jgi:hypothetical protein